MTRSARTRRGNRKTPLEATPWNSLKAPKGYTEINDQESESIFKVEKVKKGQLKETRKQKLVSKRLSKKSLTARKLEDELRDSDTLPLLSLPDAGGSSSASGGVTRKKKKKHLDAKVLKDEDSPIAENANVSATRCGTDEFYDNDYAGHGSQLKQPLIRRSRFDEKRKQRIEARRLRRQKQKVCFNCRKSGHMVQDCPEQQEPDSCVAGVCFKCGSAEHTSRTCRINSSEGDFPYAKCFICGEVGHLSRSCPDNPKGLYPKGGCCKLCGSVEHLKSNCPEKAKRNAKNDSSGFSGLVVVNPHASADAEGDAGSSIAGKGQISAGGRGQSAGRSQSTTGQTITGKRTGNLRTHNGAKHKVVEF